ncbi:MAG: hypothetical protein KC620_08740 [Myxococcales bacterium]|nr:hypothetical protein [Myxococcales bacterium]
MERFFEQSQKVFADEMSWVVEQMNKVGAEAVTEAEKLLSQGQQVMTDFAARQRTAFVEVARHTTAAAERQMGLWRDAFKSAQG